MKKLVSTCLLPLALVITVSGLAACQLTEKKPAPPSAIKLGPSDMTAKKPAEVEKLVWVNTGNPEEDAQMMLAKARSTSQKPVLVAFAGRGLSYPGLTKAEYEAVKSQVSYQVAEGSGDVLRGGADRARRKQLEAYTTVYNRTIVVGL